MTKTYNAETVERALALSFYHRDLDEDFTVRGFLQKLLHTLFEQYDGFSGKRPFGSSGWDSDMEVAFVKAGFIEGTLTDDEYEDLETSEGYEDLIHACIDAL